MGIVIAGLMTILIGAFMTGFGLSANLDTWPTWSTPIADYGGYIVIIGGAFTVIAGLASKGRS